MYVENPLSHVAACIYPGTTNIFQFVFSKLEGFLARAQQQLSSKLGARCKFAKLLQKDFPSILMISSLPIASFFQLTDVKEIALRIARFPKENGKKGRIVIITQGADPTYVVKGNKTLKLCLLNQP